MVETQNELQCECEDCQGKDVDEFEILLNTNPTLSKDDINLIKTMITNLKYEQKERLRLEQELNSLGQGTGFLDVEKLRKDISCKRREIYNTLETIRGKKESLETERGIDRAKLGEEQEGLRTLKIQCEQEYKNTKKQLDDELKQEQHRLSIDEALREKNDMNKGDWKEHVKKVLTKELANAIPLKLEALHERQQRNIAKQENKIQEQEEAISVKYGSCEEKIRELKQKVERMKIELNDLEMSRENRLEFAEINNEERILDLIQRELQRSPITAPIEGK